MKKLCDKISIKQVDIDLLKGAEYNPRKHTEKQMHALKESITQYGLVDPILVNNHPDRNNIVIGGHFRLKAAKELGIKKIPVVYLSLTLGREKELNLRLNQNMGDWDFDILKDFDMNLLLDVGFDNSELSEVWDSMLEVEEDNFDIERALEEIKEPIAKPGEIYQLGNHRIMCGDATSKEDVDKLIASHPKAPGNITMLYYDYPYNIGLSYNSGMAGTSKYGGTKTNDTKTQDEYGDFVGSALVHGLAHAQTNTHIFSWCDPNYIGLIQDVYTKLELTPRRVCMWIKNNINMTPHVAFNRSYEPCVYATRGKPYLSNDLKNLTEVLDREVGVGNGALEDVIDLFDLWLAKRLPTQDYQHPTENDSSLTSVF